MEIQTVLWIVLAVIATIAIVFFQYFHKNQRKGTSHKILAGLRFCTLFFAFLLLINPKFTKNELFLEKPNLVVLVDNSSSIGDAVDQASLSEKIESLTSDKGLGNLFQVERYSFGSQLNQSDSLLFEERQTNIANALVKIDEIYAKGATAVVLITDGNQTLGRDYEHLTIDSNISVNPVVVGDTTHFEDISIDFVNSNPYAFLKNKFPLEALISYNGVGKFSKNVTILVDGENKFRQRLDFDESNNSKTINALLQAESVGVKSIVIQVEGLPNEKNLFNNRKEVAIEVIDEKTSVTIVSDMPHPDIGALKKSIETNEQRHVNIREPKDALSDFEETDLFVLYQPSTAFKSIYDQINKSGIGVLTITGTKTNWGFLNQVQDAFIKENFNQTEEIIPVLNNSFNTFGLANFSTDNFPPLLGNLGDIQLNRPHEILMYQRIRGVDLDKPLFTVFKDPSKKEAVIFGENLWRWRSQTYRNTQSFEEFDTLMGKLMVFLTSDKRKSRLEVKHKLIFENSSEAKVRAYSFDESYSFNLTADLVIKVTNKDNSFSRELPMLLKGSFYEVDMSDFPSGDYTYTITEQNENAKRSGTFKILDFNPEKLLLSADYQKLQRLAQKSNGEVFYLDNLDSLIEKMTNSDQFVPVQKSRQNVVSLIDFRVLLALMALTLAVEWFLRKYNGLI